MPVDDGVDKLNRKYTLLVFLFLALPIFTKQYIGDPIECFAPVYFAEHQSRYINSYCWTQSTYYMVPVGDPEDDADQVSRRAFKRQLVSPATAESDRQLDGWPGRRQSASLPGRGNKLRDGQSGLIRGCCCSLMLV